MIKKLLIISNLLWLSLLFVSSDYAQPLELAECFNTAEEPNKCCRVLERLEIVIAAGLAKDTNLSSKRFPKVAKNEQEMLRNRDFYLAWRKEVIFNRQNCVNYYQGLLAAYHPEERSYRDLMGNLSTQACEYVKRYQCLQESN